ncbi:MAG TPA: M1 family aminopeptidase [Polyangia bacterium]|jgi:aminopeptidase N
MPKPFAPPGTPLRFAADRPFRVAGVRLELELDLVGRRLSGAVTHRIEARRDELDAVTLDAVEMTFDSVVVDGAAVPFDYDGEKLRVSLPRPLARGTEASVTVCYHASPRRGLYFLGPDAANPNRAPLCFTQGQDDDSRFYWPCVDAPNEKAPMEVLATAPSGNFLLSNGDLRGRDELPNGRTRWHYVLDFPHPPYLVTVVCGPFTEQVVRAPETGVEVFFYAPPGRDADARRSFARTPQMIDYFSARIGVPYPHKRYSQITVPEFIFGGMENTTAATLTDLILLDERAALDHDVDGLVSHELAHQWWGDLLTCREWSEAWLNEGFATYFEYVWREHAKGRDEADLELRADADSYFAEAHRYVRPIVWRRYDEPIHLFDGHTYDKGGRVMHMVRHILGDGPFWEAIRAYATANARRSVETRDWARAIDEVTGRNLEPFFDRWVSRAGHPELDCAWQWDDERKEGRLRVQQKQTISDELPPFQFDAGVQFEVEGKVEDRTVAVREASHVFTFRLPSRPQQVVFDPGDVILKTVKMEKPAPLWRRQLEAAPLGIDRILAAGALGNAPDPDGVVALGQALAADEFWGVRAAAARALGRTRRQDALERLLEARSAEHPRVRRAVAVALGEFRGDPRAGAVLTTWVKGGDPSLFVEGEAALALGKTRSPEAADLLAEVATRPSFQDTIRARALEGLGALGGDRAIELLCKAWRPGGPFQARKALVAALGEAANGTPQVRAVREFLEERIADADFRVRGEIAAALARLGDRQAIPAIERTLAAELDGRARRRMREAVTSLREGSGASTQFVRLQEEVERLRTETTKLRERLDKLEAREVAPERSTPPPAGGAKAAARRRPRAATRRRPRSQTPTRRR